MKILVVKMSSMGDVVHAQPLVSDIHRHVPGAQVHWLVETPFRAICDANDGIAEVLPIRFRKWRRTVHRDLAMRAEAMAFWRELRAREYDLVLDCQGLFKSAGIARLVRARRLVGMDGASVREPPAHWLYRERVAVPREWHVVARNRAVAARALGYEFEDSPADFHLDPPPLPLALGAAFDRPSPMAILVTGASRPEKLWQEDRWVEVGIHLASRGLGLLWFWGSEEERVRAEQLKARVAARAPEARQSMPPFLAIADAMSLLAQARIVVGLDTGFTQLAGALGRDTIGIYCDFDPVQCAVSGAGYCASFGGVGQQPDLAVIQRAIDGALQARS